MVLPCTKGHFVMLYVFVTTQLPSHCVCVQAFNDDGALICPTGGFPSL